MNKTIIPKNAAYGTKVIPTSLQLNQKTLEKLINVSRKTGISKNQLITHLIDTYLIKVFSETKEQKN